MIINHKEYGSKISELENTISQLQETISSLSSAVASKADSSAISSLTNTVNTKLGAWKLHQSVTGDTSISLPTNYNELLVVTYFNRTIDSIRYYHSRVIQKEIINKSKTDNMPFSFSDVYSTNAYGAYWKYTTDDKIILTNFYKSGSVGISGNYYITTSLYYR